MAPRYEKINKFEQLSQSFGSDSSFNDDDHNNSNHIYDTFQRIPRQKK